MDFFYFSADIVPQWQLNINLEAKEANKLKVVVMLTASIFHTKARHQNNLQAPDLNSLSAHGSNC